MAIADTPAIEITYIGGPTALIEIGGVTFITDPTFDAPGKDYRSGTITLRKLAGPAVDVGPLALTTRTGASKLGPNAVGLSPWERREIPAPSGVTLTVTATPARHGPAG